MRKLVIFGTLQIAEIMAFYFDNDSSYDVVAFTVDAAYLQSDAFLGRPVVAFEDLSKAFPPAEHDIFVAISYREMNKLRTSKVMAARALGYSLATYISSKAHIWRDLEVGYNCCILEGCSIQPFAKVGDNTFFWTGNFIGHHSIIGNNCFFSGHNCIAGNVKIGDFCFLGLNTTIHDGVAVATNCLIGSNSLIMADTSPGEVYLPRQTAPRKLPSSRARL